MLSTTHHVGVNHRHTLSPEETSTTPCEGTRTKIVRLPSPAHVPDLQLRNRYHLVQLKFQKLGQCSRADVVGYAVTSLPKI
jgi:hypothetical protein